MYFYTFEEDTKLLLHLKQAWFMYHQVRAACVTHSGPPPHRHLPLLHLLRIPQRRAVNMSLAVSLHSSTDVMADQLRAMMQELAESSRVARTELLLELSEALIVDRELKSLVLQVCRLGQQGPWYATA